MDNALERFFNKIDFNNREAFKDAKVVKVVVNNKNDSWEVYIHAPNVIDINAFNELSLLSSKGIDPKVYKYLTSVMQALMKVK